MLLFFDVETTGLPRRRSASYKDVDNWPRIVSISWALYGSDECLVEHRYAVVRPDGFAIPVDSTRVLGITTEYARTHGQLLIEVLNELEGDVEHYKPSLLVAHNVDFDRNVLLAEMLRARRQSAVAGIPTFCTMRETVDFCKLPRYSGGYKWPTLDELYQRLFGEGFENAHDASADVQACVRCYFELKQRDGEHQRW